MAEVDHNAESATPDLDPECLFRGGHYFSGATTRTLETADDGTRVVEMRCSMCKGVKVTTIRTRRNRRTRFDGYGAQNE